MSTIYTGYSILSVRLNDVVTTLLRDFSSSRKIRACHKNKQVARMSRRRRRRRRRRRLIDISRDARDATENKNLLLRGSRLDSGQPSVARRVPSRAVNIGRVVRVKLDKPMIAPMKRDETGAMRKETTADIRSSMITILAARARARASSLVETASERAHPARVVYAN
jgi:ribosomal protein L18E